MRTRYKKYSDYGLTQDEVMTTYSWLNNIEEDDKSNVHDIVTNQLPPSVSEYVFLALTEHKKYRELCHLGLDYYKIDFYGYKRKGLYLSHEYMKSK